MIMKIDHIGIAVRNLEEAMATYGGILGLESTGTEKIVGQRIIVTTLIVGGVKIELLQPTQPDGPVANFIGKRGEGMHHIAFRVENIEESLRRLKERGVELIDEKARIGARGARIAFLHPKGMHGVLVELVERP